MNRTKTFLLLGSLLLLCGAAHGGIKRLADGTIQANELKFGFQFYAGDWKSGATQKDIKWTPAGENKNLRTGIFQTKAGNFDFTETFNAASENEVRYEAQFSSEKGVRTGLLLWRTTISRSFYTANPAVFNGKPVVLPEGKREIYLPGKKGNLLQIPLKDGMLEIRGSFAVNFRFSANHADLRLAIGGGNLKKARLNIQMKFIPAQKKEVPAGKADFITRSADGCLLLNGVKFHLAICRRNWSVVAQSQPNVAVFLGEGGEETPQGIRRTGTFRVTENDIFNFTELIGKKADGSSRIVYTLTADKKPQDVELFIWEAFVPAKDYEKNPLTADGKPVLLTKPQVNANGSCFELPLKDGLLQITGRKRLVIVSRAGNKVRLRFVFGYRNWTKAVLDLTVKLLPYSSTPVDLAAACNMGFKDEKANDRKGGWTDQGSQNDLSMMKPGLLEFNGVKFNILSPADNGRRSCIAFKGAARPYFASNAKVSVPALSGRGLYLLNALAWAPAAKTPCGKVIVTYQDGSTQTNILKCEEDTGNFWNPRSLANAEVAWRGQNGEATIGLYATFIPLKSVPVTALEFVSENQIWLVVAATVSNQMPAQKSENVKIVMKPDENWAFFPYTYDTVKGSVMDFSGTLDAPAGKYGFLTVKGDHFEFTGRPGVPVRFWGMNICQVPKWYENRELVKRMCDDIAARGCNLMRFHHFDWDITSRKGDFDVLEPAALDRMEYLISELKKRGIYYTIDLFTARWPKIKKFHRLNPSDYKLLCYVNKEVRQDLLRLSKELLSRKNPYTGLRWADDPALVFINLINEGTLTVAANRPSALTKPYLEKAFKQWAEANKVTLTAENRGKYFPQFLNDIGKEFFDDFKRELASIGVRIPLSDQNFANPPKKTQEHFDYVDTHFYFCHPVYIGEKLWRLPSFTPASSPIGTNLGGLRGALTARIAGKPFTVTEWNFCAPNPHFFEGTFLTAAYAAMQDFNAMVQFNYVGGEMKDGAHLPGTIGAFTLVSNPMHALGFRAGAMLYLRGDTATSAKAVELSESENMAYGQDLARRVRVSIKTTDSARSEKELLAAAGLKEPLKCKTGAYVSSTNEITLKPAEEFFSVNSPKSNVLLLAAKKAASAGVLSVRNGNTPAAFYIGSLDNKPLKESSRMILMHLTDIKNENSVFGDKEKTILRDYGSKTLLLRKNSAAAELALSGAVKVYACAFSGKRLFEVPLEKENGKVKFTLNNVVNKQPVTVYEIVK